MDELLARTAGPMIGLRLEPAPEPRFAIADPNQLELAILNLAINARDAMPDGGRLTITTGPHIVTEIEADSQTDGPAPGRYLVISVSDTGTGMSAEVRARAMEPFFTTKEVGRGTGLGLAQVYGIARQSGGDVRIDSTPGEGTTVSILLPAASARTAAADTARSDACRDQPAEPRPGGARPGGRRRRRCSRDLHHRARGTRLRAARMRATARSQSRSIGRDPTIDAAILDFAMPGMNGAVLAEEIRRKRPGLPILIASGYADTAALDRVPDAPILRKPVRMAELAEALQRTMLPSKQPARLPPVRLPPACPKPARPCSGGSSPRRRGR